MSKTPQQIVDALNTYDEGRGWRGQNGWFAVPDDDYLRSVHNGVLAFIAVEDAAAIVEGWDAQDELAVVVRQLSEKLLIYCVRRQQLVALTEEICQRQETEDSLTAWVAKDSKRLEVAERLAQGARIALGNWHCGSPHPHLAAALAEWDALKETQHEKNPDGSNTSTSEHAGPD